MSEYIFERLSVKVNGIEKFYNVPKINECPHCHNGIAPYVLTISETDMETRTFAIIAQCPRCSKYFIMAYKLPFGTKIPQPIEYKITNKINYKDYTKELKKISERFVEVYGQALISETYNLHEIASIGFKKSIEILTRDYLINFRKENKIEILRLSFKDILKKIPDSKIVDLAMSFNWSEYVEFSDNFLDKKDIEDMKKFIDVFSKFIIYSYSVEKW